VGLTIFSRRVQLLLSGGRIGSWRTRAARSCVRVLRPAFRSTKRLTFTVDLAPCRCLTFPLRAWLRERKRHRSSGSRYTGRAVPLRERPLPSQGSDRISLMTPLLALRARHSPRPSTPSPSHARPPHSFRFWRLPPAVGTGTCCGSWHGQRPPVDLPGALLEQRPVRARSRTFWRCLLRC